MSDEEMIETTEEDPIAHQGGPATGGNSTLNLLQSLVPVGRDAPKAAPCLSQASDSIEEPSQTQGARGEAEPEVPGEQTGGAQVLLRSAEDDILSALQVSGRTKTYSSKGGGRGALVNRVLELREEQRRVAANWDEGEKGDGFAALVESSSYECGFRKCWCRLEGGGFAWVILRGSACCDVNTSQGAKLRVAPPYQRRRVGDADVLLVTRARN